MRKGVAGKIIGIAAVVMSVLAIPASVVSGAGVHVAMLALLLGGAGAWLGRGRLAVIALVMATLAVCISPLPLFDMPFSMVPVIGIPYAWAAGALWYRRCH